MGTQVRFIAYTSEKANEATTRQAIAAALFEIRRLEKLMSTWLEDSEVSRINQRAGEWVEVSKETFSVVEKSLWASKISNGAFDISFKVLGDLWRFGDAAMTPPELPSKAAIAQRRALINYRNVELNDASQRIRIKPKMRIGLGGIAKGYAIDRAAQVLHERGVKNFLAQAGGDLLGSGTKPNGEPWVSGIRDPRGKADSFFATIQLTNHAFSTAGDYARSFIIDNKRYHHIIDPKTGYPATACRSVTIWASDALTADAIDDAVFILGPQRGLNLVESLDGVGAVIVDSNNKVTVSSRLEGKVRLLQQPTDGL